MKLDRHVFISDVHFGAFSEKTSRLIENDLIALIDYCKNESIALYILGDLFDYWMEYPEKGFVPKLGQKILTAFEDYNQKISPALYITGNHDNWTFGHFEERGFNVETDFRLIEINGKQILLMHGDGIATEEINFPRPLFHRLLRNPVFVKAYQNILPPKTGLALMKKFSSFTQMQSINNPNPLNRLAQKLFESYNLDFIITGHDHIPRVETFSQGSYINLGTFFNHRTVALYNNKGLQLVRWKAASKKFLPFEGNN